MPKPEKITGRKYAQRKNDESIKKYRQTAWTEK